MHLLVPDMQRDLELDPEPTGLSLLLGVEGACQVKHYLLFGCLHYTLLYFSLLLACGSKS